MRSLQLALAARQENIKAARALRPAMCLVRVALLQILVQQLQNCVRRVLVKRARVSLSALDAGQVPLPAAKEKQNV